MYDYLILDGESQQALLESRGSWIHSGSGCLIKKRPANFRLHPIEKTKKESPRWSSGQTPGFIRCLSCFQLYPLVVVKVNVFINELFGFLKGSLFEVS